MPAARHVAIWVACGVFAAVLLVAAFVKPALILYPIYMFLGLLIVIAFFVILPIYIYYHDGVQKFIDDTYRIPGTQIVLRTTYDPWALQVAPHLEVRVGDGAPLKFCMAGPSLTRAQFYSVESGGILLETARDTFLIRTTPFSVEGPPSWMHSYVFPNKGRCDYDARSDAPDRERFALKAGLKLTYIGAFDQVSDRSWYRRFWPASLSPEQKITP